MFLYHKTDVPPDLIKKEGLRGWHKSEDTEIINKVLNKLDSHPNWLDRNGCVFFHFDKEPAFGEYIVTVDSSVIDESRLFVADEGYAQEIFNAIYYGKEETFYDLARKYWDSLKKFKDYLCLKTDYQQPEVLCLCDIPPEWICFIEQV